MLSKSLLSLAIAASLVGMSGCNISSTTDSANATPSSQVSNDATQAQEAIDNVNVVTPRFDALAADFPIGIDFIFAAQASADIPASLKDGTAHTGSEGKHSENPVTNGLDDLDGGISVLAPIDIAMSGSITEATVVAGGTVHLVKLPNAADVATYNMTLPDGVTALNIDALDLSSLGAFFVQTLPDGSAPAAPEDAANLVIAKNLPLMMAMQPVVNTDFEVSVISLDGGTDNTIRISPKTPLDAKSKYIVVITGGITSLDNPGTDADEAEAIQASKNYSYVQGASDLFTPALAGVRASVQGWESMASAIITGGGNAALLPRLAGGIVLTAGFTTVGPTTVLKSMASPTYWLPSVVTNNTIADAVIEAGLGEGSSAGVIDAAKIPTALAVANGALTAANPALGGGTAYSHPRARSFEVIKNVGGDDVHQLPVSAVSGGLLTENVLVSQGAIELPQYTVAFATNPNDYWDGNTTIGAVLDGALGQPAGTTPPSDINGQKNVTYRYPFAMEQRKIVAPVLMFEPTGASTAVCTKPGAGWPVIIMQHGFTSKRTDSMVNATKLADNSCHAVIAMDLPHHGIPANSTALALGVNYVDPTTPALTPFAAAAAAIVAGTDASATILDDLAERHEDFYMSATGAPAQMVYGDDATGSSGSLWIRLDNFQRTRDNMRQATMDLLNLNASIGAIDLNGDGIVPDLDVANVNFIGHSLGGIVGTTFVAVNNDATVQAGNANLPKIQKAILATPGGSLGKMLESSVAIGPQIIGGLAASGIAQGTSTFEAFIKVMQASIDSADPMNFISDLAAGGSSETPTLIIEMVGDSPTVPADLVVPNNGVGDVLASGAVRLESAQSPFVGTDPMIALLNATNVVTSTTEEQLFAKYNLGDHGTFSSADPLAAYGEMLTQSIQFITTGNIATANTNNVLVAD